MKAVIRGIDKPARSVNALPVNNSPYSKGFSNAWEVDRYAREGVRTTDLLNILFACWAEAYPEPVLKVYDAEEETAELKKSEVGALIKNPVAGMSWTELMEVDILFTLLSGTTYLHKRRDGSGKVVELMPYSDAIITGVSETGATEWVSYYNYNNRNGSQMDIPAKDICALPWIVRDPLQPWKGLSPIKAGARQFDIDTEFTKVILAMLYNGAFPGTAIGMSTNADDAMDVDMDMVKEYLEQNFGAENRGRPIVLNGKLSSVKLQSGLQDMLGDTWRNIPETRACALFRVPPILAYTNAGLQRSTFSNVEESRLFWHTNTLVPFWKRRAAKLTESLRPEFPNENFVLRYDFSKVDALRERSYQEQEQAIAAYEAGLLQYDEAREPFPYENEPPTPEKMKGGKAPNENLDALKLTKSKVAVSTNGEIKNV